MASRSSNASALQLSLKSRLMYSKEELSRLALNIPAKAERKILKSAMIESSIELLRRFCDINVT